MAIETMIDNSSYACILLYGQLYWILTIGRRPEGHSEGENGARKETASSTEHQDGH